MKQIKNMCPGVTSPKIKEDDFWSFECSEWDEKSNFKIFHISEEEVKEKFISSEDLHPEIKGINYIQNIYGTEEIEEDFPFPELKNENYKYIISSEAEEENSYLYEALRLKIKLNKIEEIEIDNNTEGVYLFDFLKNESLTLKFVFGTIDKITSIEGMNKRWAKENFVLLNSKIPVSNISSNTSFIELIPSLEILYTFKIFDITTEEKKEVYPTYKEQGYFLRSGRKYSLELKSKEEIKQDFKCYTIRKGEQRNYSNYVRLNGYGSEDSRESASYLITGENLVDAPDDKVINEPKYPIKTYSNLQKQIGEDYDDKVEDGEEYPSKITVFDTEVAIPKSLFTFVFSIIQVSIDQKILAKKISFGEKQVDSNYKNDFAKIKYKPLNLFSNKGEYFIVTEEQDSTGFNTLTEPYEIVEKPKYKITESFDLNENFLGFDFEYLETNTAPKLWHKIQIYNIDENKKRIPIYNSKEIYTSAPNFTFNYDLFLPNEKYEIIISCADVNNIKSDEYIIEHNTSDTSVKINFSKKEIIEKTSESFIKIMCKEFGFGKNLFPSLTLYPGSNIYPQNLKSKDFVETKILRQNILDNSAIWVATISKEEANMNKEIKVYDYGAKANIPYVYWAYGIFSSIPEEEDDFIFGTEGLQGIKLNDEPIIAEWDRWTLVTADKDPKDEKVYHVDKVFTFEMNLSSGSMTNGTNITTSKNFTEFPIIQKDKSNFYSGSLTALMGVRKWGSTAEDFEQTPHMLEELRQLSTNYQPKFLKDRSGHLWRVEINGAINVANTDNLAAIDLKTMTIPWVQIGEADDISLIYVGDEKKEELYC